MKVLIRNIVIICCLLISSNSVIAQIKVKGTVLDEKKQPLSGVFVSIKDMNINTSTNVDGVFSVILPKAGKYMFILSGIGYLKQEQTINLTVTPSDLSFTLAQDVTQLQTVSVMGKSSDRRLKDQSIKAGVIEMRDVYHQPATLTELINRSSGIKIRQSGGLGANTDISLNGFQGKAIRYFRDGVPLDYLGDGFGLSSLPGNMLQRVEVYKGVLPVGLGADALGGAVNLVSRLPSKKYAEAAYEIASFNTHRFSLNTYYIDTLTNAFVGVDGFFNYSDNNYKVSVKATDPDTRNQFDAKVPLFHNAYKGHFVQLYAGLKNKAWADELKLTLAKHGNDREQQHPALMTDPYGAVMAKQSSFVPSLDYSKSFLENKLRVAQFLTASTLNIKRIDTLHGSYDWFGKFTPNPLKQGETRQPSNSSIEQSNFTSRTSIAYQLAQQHKLELNAVYSSADRKGEDPLGPRFSGTDIDVLSMKSSYNKFVGALGLSSDFMGQKLNHQLIGKIFSYKASGIEAYEARPVFSDEIHHVKGTTWGIADALKYEFNVNHLIRFSTEYATRLSDQNELFGDAIFVVPNFRLRPERSLNFNLGYRFQKGTKYQAEVNTFYRRTKDLILLVPIQQPYAHFENQENVKGFGIELEGSMQVMKDLVLNANVTLQDLRLFNIVNSSGSGEKEGARLRNTPYFFGNIGVNYSLHKLKLYGYYNYLKEYYLETIPKKMEPDGFLGLFGSAKVNSLLLIPDQHLLSAGLSYPVLGKKITSSFEVKNILDKQLFDNYKVEKAGRSFHLKLIYTIY